MLFYSSPVLPVICNHPEMLHITTAAGKQAKLVNQGGCGTGQCPHEVFSAYWKSFAQDDPPLLVLHRLHLFCLVEKWPLPAMWSILGRCCRTAFKQFTWTEKQLTETKSFELVLETILSTWWKGCFLDGMEASPELVPVYPCQFWPTWWDRNSRQYLPSRIWTILLLSVLCPSLPKSLLSTLPTTVPLK